MTKQKSSSRKKIDKLNKRITGLETVETERKKAEEEMKASYQQLKATEQQLRAANQQLDASNQQLQATEQQLRAANQQLKASNQQLQANEQQLRAANQQLKASEQEREKLFHKMRERVKELNCFYSLSKLIEQPGISLEEIFEKMVYIISKNWHYPDITCARIVFENNEFKTDNFKKTKWKQSADIKVYENKSGYIEVYYLVKKPELGEGPFLKEERNLIDSLAEQFGRLTERKKAEEELKTAYQQLQASERQLRAANQQLDASIQHLRASEQDIRKSEEKYRSVFENTGTATIITEENTIISIVNEKFEKLSGFTREEIEGRMSWVDFVVKDDLERMKKHHFERRKKGGEAPHHYEFSFIDKNKNIKNIFLVVDVISGTKKSVASLLDITERKRAEEELLKREAQLSNAMEIAKLGYWEYDVTEDLFTFNDHFYAIFRTTAEKVGGYKMSSAQYAEQFIHPDDKAVVGIETRKAIETIDHHFNRKLEHRIIYANGEIGYIAVRFFIVKDKKGRTIKTYGANQDITERRKAGEKLRLFRSLIDQSNDVVEIIDPKTGYFIDTNERGCMDLGYSREEFLSLRVFDIDPLVEQSIFAKTIKDIKKSGTLLFESIHQRKDGSTFPVEINMKYVHLEQDYLITVARNITERKQIFEKLKHAKEYSAILINSSLDMIISVDANRKIMEFNRAAEKIFGYTKAEVSGKSVDILYADPSQGLQVHKATIKGSEFESEILNKRKNGEIFISYLSSSVLRDTTGAFIGIMGISRDITERKKAEEKIKSSLREKEILLKEIHHRVKNNMQIISSLLLHQADRIKDKKNRDIYYKSINRVKIMSIIHELLYQSKDFAHINSQNYINNILENLSGLYLENSRNIEVITDSGNINVSIDNAIPFGLIINELVLNSLKHGFPDNKKGKITIMMKKVKDKKIELKICDNGVGIPQTFDWKNTDSLGLHIVNLLAEVQLEGTIELTRTEGTEFRITF